MAHYLELEIFDKDIKKDTEPVISSGFEFTEFKTLNYGSVDKCIKLIGDYGFSERFLNNYNDPLFIFLNIKTRKYKNIR